MSAGAAGSRILRIATRTSRLARWQADHVQSRLAALHPELTIEIVPITTRGDEVRDRALHAIGGRGLFTKELEQVLLAGGADLAVHSLKDLETTLPAGLTILAVPERADPSDVWVSRSRTALKETPAGTRVGTSSIRRRAQLLALRPDLVVVDLRGNVPTRIAKLERGEDGIEATVLARAGLLRLGLDELATEVLAPAICLPAVGQGALAIEGRIDNPWIRDLVAPLEHPATRLGVRAERAFLHRLGGGCQVPAGALAQVHGITLEIEGVVCAPDGSVVVRDRVSGPAGDPEAAGEELARALMNRGAEQILADLESAARRSPPAGS
jgi:hydroxymethylbilane synthase